MAYKRITLRLPEPLFNRLNTIAKKTGTKVATSARDLLAERISEVEKANHPL